MGLGTLDKAAKGSVTNWLRRILLRGERLRAATHGVWIPEGPPVREGPLFVPGRGTQVLRDVSRRLDRFPLMSCIQLSDVQRATLTELLAGHSADRLADLLGHSDTRMVWKHYRHVISDSVDVAADYWRDTGTD